MSTAQSVSQYLPFLRRYARALTGSQQSGDRYVAATLEALIEDPSVIKGVANQKVGLYRLFTSIWGASPLAGMAEEHHEGLPTEKRIAQITSQPRQAFLLVALEGFSEDEAAEVLDVPANKVADLIDASGRELAAEIATDVLIIEDEPLIAIEIEGLVEGLGHRVIGVARTHREAIALAGAKRPGLILADIQLADGSSGLNAVNELLKTFEVPVIFITAFPERFLTGERPEPAFLIPKPFQPSSVSAVISQALFFERRAKRKERRTA
jgi:DNA-directed RNA polymerase specialized sigma24 family protein/CheY-like chemotaxis protein